MSRPRPYLDLRFLGGVFLIVLAVILAVVALQRSSATAPLAAASRPIAPGETVSEDDLVAVSARVPGDIYLESGKLPHKAVATRPIAAGELVPRSALAAQAAGSDLLVVTLAQPMPTGVARGETLVLWAAPARSGATTPDLKAHILTREATYVGPGSSASGAVAKGSIIDVRVPTADVEAVVTAQGQGIPILAVQGGGEQ
ncbi:MAG: SAF domain-containing protein [Actinomycetaceae bacterium]|nr:SAF domain-containing protein [Actinomycetaceae bacterium]